MWDEVLEFWNDVEATKLEDNLRTMLEGYYWADMMVKATRVVKLTGSDKNRHTAWESAVGRIMLC